ncbi:MAG: bifunctional tRNA (5-methylaminomethyl-2-thiouridine)(34)-methyltransferase MnmD/FAD-dependent 5-carboxymethylaminomethyl-2-thiouridine(34) oxidoreductase MnmC [Gammaproteobacteria bacterium]|nr:bifunctional tRNA (5-methylaminomethyl-2-thiouridine)(34)-methyltransferase MnmD/FAD-dependent 5-carboxymethylaminomethyl-2-thiouridine(34) oxidoreductase MnmC [Gammaproteobacteria bacterium]MBQ0840247.1 bifunctional tRNA (5-methylaminomethyl-2-thiouridine)(34)-methyltransferase MnmD/FAD-dependent 5-carboxymethylaminomethyl-2-thiouridine(34) oxidoreductase MnmC [Gammaproteobacteria bacterium]
MSKKLAEITPAQLTPEHYSRASKMAEHQQAFIEHNKLRQRWQALDPQINTTFVIGETRFGAGQNFLAAAELWLKSAPATAKLHFIALEAAPLCRSDLKHALQQETQVSALARQLLAHYPLLSPGFHRLFFAEQRICLTLIFVDADCPSHEALAQLRPSLHPSAQRIKTTVDAWFLNNTVTEALCEQLAYFSHTGSTLVSLNADEPIKKTLHNIGFTLNTAPSPKGKQALLYGQWHANTAKIDTGAEVESSPATPSPSRSKRRTRHQNPWHISAAPHRSASRHAAIIGGGIAACTTAAALAQRGWRVTLYERHKNLASEGSGNPQGIVYPKLSPKSSVLSRINLSAIQFASRFYQDFWQTPADRGQLGQQCGVLVLPENTKQTATFKTIGNNFKRQKEFIQLLNKSAIENISGLPIDAPIGLYYPQLGWLNPPKVCQALVAHPLIRVEQANITGLNYHSPSSSWQLSNKDKGDFATADTVVLATSTSTGQFSQTKHLPIKAIRGQISVAPRSSNKQQLKTVLCGAGYIAPADNGQYTFGASYNLNNSRLDICVEDHQHNIDLLEQSASGLANTLQIPAAEQLSGRAALRCTTLDYLPIVGPAPIYEHFLEDYADLRRDASTDISRPGQYWPGLFIHCGLGSRGLGYAPLGAELLASQINGEPAALERELLTALNPARFIIRDLKRRKI